MRALQALVIVMGVLLLAGSAVIAVTIMHRMSSGTLHAAGPAAGPAAGSAVTLPPRVSVQLPAGSHLETVVSIGDKLGLHVSGPEGNAVLVVDPATGAIVETITIGAQP